MGVGFDGFHKRHFGRGKVVARGRSCFAGITALQRVDIEEMFVDRTFVADPLIRLIPLKMVVKDQLDQLLKLADKAVLHDPVDRRVKSFIQR